MGCRFGKPPVVASSTNVDIRARREETYRLLAELGSLGIASWPPPSLMLEECSLHPVSLAVARTPQLKLAISKNPALLSFINNHLNYVIKTLRSLTGVKGQIDKARIIFCAVRLALEFFEKGNAKRNNKKKKNKNNKKKKKSNTYVDKLSESREVGNPFAGPNTDEIRSACERLQSLLAALNRGDHELDKRRRSVKKCKKAWNIIYMAGTAAVLACSVILAAVASPAAAIAGITASATAMKAVEPWIDSLWDGWEGSLHEEKDVIAAMQRKAGLVVRELENVRSMVERLKIDMDAVLKAVEFAISGEEDGEEMEVKIGIENIMAKKGEVESGIDSLEEKLDLFGGEIGVATTELVEIITKDT